MSRMKDSTVKRRKESCFSYLHGLISHFSVTRSCFEKCRNISSLLESPEAMKNQQLLSWEARKGKQININDQS